MTEHSNGYIVSVHEHYDGEDEVCAVYDNETAATDHVLYRKAQVWSSLYGADEDEPYPAKLSEEEADDLMSAMQKDWRIWTETQTVQSEFNPEDD